MDRQWHYTKDSDYPQLFGEYVEKSYPQIPCLVLYRNSYCVRYWNNTAECWDDEECDDFFCSKDEVQKWMYIDSLDEETDGMVANQELVEELSKRMKYVEKAKDSILACNYGIAKKLLCKVLYDEWKVNVI